MTHYTQCPRLVCVRGHEHLLTDEQVVRFESEPCCWCGTPLSIVVVSPESSARLETVRRFLHRSVGQHHRRERERAAQALNDYWRDDPGVTVAA